MDFSTIILNCSEGIKDLIVKNIVRSTTPGGPDFSDLNVVFDSPADDQRNLPTVLVYLYHLQWDPQLLNAAPVFSQGKNIKGEMNLPPYPVQLFYMITPYAENRAQELVLIDLLLSVFIENPTFNILEIHPSGPVHILNDQVKLIQNNPTMDEVSRFWTTFPSRHFKLSLFFIATPVLLPTGTKPFDRVTRVTSSYGKLDKNGKVTPVDHKDYDGQ